MRAAPHDLAEADLYGTGRALFSAFDHLSDGIIDDMLAAGVHPWSAEGVAYGADPVSRLWRTEVRARWLARGLPVPQVGGWGTRTAPDVERPPGVRKRSSWVAVRRPDAA